MKDKTTAGVLALLLGWFGVHKFYLGETRTGVLYLLFCWAFVPAILGLIDGIGLLQMQQVDFDAKYNAGAASMVAPIPAGGDVAARLKALYDLKVSGALTEEEFAEQKRKLLK